MEEKISLISVTGDPTGAPCGPLKYYRIQAVLTINLLGPCALARATRRRFLHAVFLCYTAPARTLSLYI